VSAGFGLEDAGRGGYVGHAGHAVVAFAAGARAVVALVAVHGFVALHAFAAGVFGTGTIRRRRGEGRAGADGYPDDESPAGDRDAARDVDLTLCE